MDTYEARLELLQLGRRALEIAHRFEHGDTPSAADRTVLREMVASARAVLPDAGYPGEAIWRGLQRTSIGAETSLDGSDSKFWNELCVDIQSGVDTLLALVSPDASRDPDFHLVG